MTYEDLVRALMNLADLGIVNAKADTQLLRDAALFIDCQQLKIDAMKEKIYELEERIGIMEDGNQVTIAPGSDVDLMPTIEQMERKTSGLLEED